MRARALGKCDCHNVVGIPPEILWSPFGVCSAKRLTLNNETKCEVLDQPAFDVRTERSNLNFSKFDEELCIKILTFAEGIVYPVFPDLSRLLWKRRNSCAKIFRK